MQRGKASEIQREILKTLIYADIFDYPLTLIELEKFLIGRSGIGAKTAKKTLLEILTDLKQIDTDGELYFLKGREKIVRLRKRREGWAKEKWGIAEKTARKLQKLPMIKLIGVTGALAMNNTHEEDDIDLLVVSSVNSLWLTRLLIFLLCPVLGIKRRKPGEKKVKNKICFNLFLDESHLKVRPTNLFLAHEVCQVKPLVNKDKTYERFLWENRWVRDYLPNAISFNNETMEQSNNGFMASLLHCFIAILNQVAFFLQYGYMKPKMTCERVSLHQAFFYPQDLQDKILNRYLDKVRGVTL